MLFAGVAPTLGAAALLEGLPIHFVRAHSCKFEKIERKVQQLTSREKNLRRDGSRIGYWRSERWFPHRGAAVCW